MDRKDRAILGALQKDATMTVGDIADQIGLSKSACWRRIQALEDDGVISARVTLLDQEKLGLDLTVFTGIRTHEHTQQWFDGFLCHGYRHAERHGGTPLRNVATLLDNSWAQWSDGIHRLDLGDL